MIDIATISALVANGFTVTLLPDGSMKVEGPTDTRSENAKRCARYRMSKACQNVSNNVESVSQHNTPSPSPSPSSPPSPLSPTPPIPAPAPTPPSAPPPTRTRVRRDSHYEPTAEFAEFWQLYPRREGKFTAWKAWEKVQPDIEQVKAALSWQSISDNWLRDDGKYIPQPASYLNQRRFEDENPNATGSFFGSANLTQPIEEEEEPFHVIFARNKAKRDAEQGVDPDVPPTAEEISQMQEEMKW